MSLMPRRWLGHLVVCTVLAAACNAAREPAAPAQPPAPTPQLPAAQPTAEVVAFEAAEVREAPATRAPENAPYRPGIPTPTPAPSPFLSWVQVVRPTPLLSGTTEDAEAFTTLPAQTYLKILEARAGWLLVVYGGDGETRRPGNAWVRATDVAPPSTAPQWLKNHRVTNFWQGPDATLPSFTNVPQWSLLEWTGQERTGRLLVRQPGDGRYRLPGHAWVDAADIGPVQTPGSGELPRAYPAITRFDVARLQVPYRSQLDGAPWAEANCGPTALGMALEALGVRLSSTQLRRDVLNAQELWGDDVGVFMEALAKVAQGHGARVLDLLQERERLKRWTLEDIRGHVREGRPVILQVVYRGLPGRGDSLYDGDHFIVITGLVGNDFLYNDPVDSDGLGYDRMLSAPQLVRAMNASDSKYAYAGFAIARR